MDMEIRMRATSIMLILHGKYKRKEIDSDRYEILQVKFNIARSEGLKAMEEFQRKYLMDDKDNK